MKILIINPGSTSCRFSLYDDDALIVKGGCEEIGQKTSSFVIKENNLKSTTNLLINNYTEAIDIIFKTIIEKKYINSIADLTGIGIRIINGGNVINNSIRIDDNNFELIKKMSKIDIIHGSKLIEVIEYIKNTINFKKLYAVFDTAFHNTIPKENYMYAVPEKWLDELGIRKYGFHGLSYQSALKEYSEKAKKDQKILMLYYAT